MGLGALVVTAMWAAAVAASPLPECLVRASATEASQAVLARAGVVADEEILARLTYAEAISTGSPDDAAVYRMIAWGTMNRVRLAEASAQAAARYGRGVPGVVFKAGQFNPAVSTRSRFGAMFLCPQGAGRRRRRPSVARPIPSCRPTGSGPAACRWW